MLVQFVAAVACLGLLAPVHATPQRAAYSLQAAVDELHRREAAKYPLNAPPPSTHFGADTLDDWDDESDLFGTGNKLNKNRNRHRINKAIAKYLERDNVKNYELSPFSGYDFDDERDQQANLNSNANSNLYVDEKRKRSSSPFRERDEQYDSPVSTPVGGASVFRERENLGNGNGDHVNGDGQSHSELTEQFLREIEEASEHERQDRYKAALRQLWEKYQQQENELTSNGDEQQEQEQQLFEQKKRMRMPPYYLLMQKKRSYPVLPWLPYNADKKKRFPVAKRAVADSPLAKTDERVAQELSELFGKPVNEQQSEEKKKRSTEEQLKSASTTHQPETAGTATALGDMRLEINFQRVNVTNAAPKESPTSPPAKPAAGTGEMVMHGGHAGHHRKRSEHHSDEEYGEHDEHDGEGEGEESSDEDDHDEFDEDDETEGEGEGEAGDRRRKKKRAASAKHMHGPGVGHLMLRAKKSIDWSQYFGLDRKKKSEQLSDSSASKKDNNNNNNNQEEEEKKKRDIDPEKLESMDKKLQSIEDFIIEETIKYTGAHEGVSSQDEIRKLKEHILSRLATAYSLEKMRRALDKLRQSVDVENHLLRNVIESDSDENSLDDRWSSKKRYSVKKEQAEEQAEDSPQSKKKRSGYMRYPEPPNNMEEALSLTGSPYEPLNDAYLGNKNYIIGSNQCPIIESMAERCRSVDLISGDLNQELLPLCGVHQICYLCGTSQVACDYQYLAEADTICGSSNDCQAAARSVLMILRGTPGRQMGPRECLKNPCLYRAMREIGL
ncbi:hypothetical protein ACLKA7_014487 [Drosophila subpalustris]